MVPDAVDKQVVASATIGEVFLDVINDPICADGSDHVNIPRTTYGGHMRAERPRDLHSEGAHSSRRTVNQDILPRPDVPLVAKTLQGAQCRSRYGGRFLKRRVTGLRDQCCLG